MRRAVLPLWSLSGVLCAVFLTAGACTPDRLPGELDLPDSPPGSMMTDGSCRAGQTRCDADEFQTCQAGKFANQQVCQRGAMGQVCDGKLGCVACKPSLGNVCEGDNIRQCNSDGSVGAVLEQCAAGQCQGGRCSTSCNAMGVDLVYVVDTSDRLYSFNPRDPNNAFRLLGTLRCPTGSALDGSGKAHPFSMSVDRMGRAWVLYNSGEIFWASTKDASCTASGFKPRQSGFELYGMGFVSDTAGAEQETLYLAGGPYNNQSVGDLGRVDSALTVSKIGSLRLQGQSSPELTGTGKAELWGYFPGGSPFVAQIDKATAMNKATYSLPRLTGTPTGWAFAHWGGRYYVFITVSTGGDKSYVYEFDPATGMAKVFLSDTKIKVVGAGVSTCAPVIIG